MVISKCMHTEVAAQVFAQYDAVHDIVPTGIGPGKLNSKFILL